MLIILLRSRLIGEFAGALDKMQAVVVAPALYIFLADKIHRSDKLHSLEIRAVKLRHHRLYLTAVDHSHKYRFDNIVKMMTERDLVAAEFLCLCVKIAAPHSRAKITRIRPYVEYGRENIRFKYRQRNVEKLRIFFDYPAVRRAVARIHKQKNDLKLHFVVTLYLLKKLRHKERILSARNADGYFVALADKLIFVERSCEAAEE